MQFSIQKSHISNLNYFFRRIGYLPIPSTKEKKASFIRHIHRTDFPRFHMYVSQNADNILFDIHMDLLRPQHQKFARASESFGPPIENEIERIKSLTN